MPELGGYIYPWLRYKALHLNSSNHFASRIHLLNFIHQLFIFTTTQTPPFSQLAPIAFFLLFSLNPLFQVVLLLSRELAITSNCVIPQYPNTTATRSDSYPRQRRRGKKDIPNTLLFEIRVRFFNIPIFSVRCRVRQPVDNGRHDSMFLDCLERDWGRRDTFGVS